MFILVNRELVPEPLIHMEFERLLFHPDFAGIADELEKRQRVRRAAEESATNRMLLTQEALRDPRPLPEAEVQAVMAEFRQQNGEHARFDELTLRPRIEARLRVSRAIREIKAQARNPSEREAKQRYRENPDSFHAPPCNL